MAFNAEADVLIMDIGTITTDTSTIYVTVKSYNKGAQKLDLRRERNDRIIKLGRLTIPETLTLLELLTDAEHDLIELAESAEQ